MTRLCVAIFVRDAAQARRDVALAAEAGADIVELRLDDMPEPAIPVEIIRNSTLPCIVTCRPTWEGGRSTLSDEDRLKLLAGCIGAAHVDLELKTYLSLVSDTHPARAEMKLAIAQLPGLILSSHDFSGRPDRMHNLLMELNSGPARVVKIVWTARTIRDNIEAFEILSARNKPTIALCMGDAGIISRALAKKFGAFLTFASLSKETETAPGQLTLDDLKQLYRWDEIGEKTRVFGVVAHPVRHSMSPAIHNRAFAETGFDGVYLPLLVEGSYESFKASMESAPGCAGLDLSGLSITLPHKENALRYLREKGAEVEELASRIGAVNTIIINRANGTVRLKGINTDYAAILDSITDKLGISREGLQGVRVAVIGAGGTGRTAVAALASCGATVIVYNRTRDRADALVAEFNATPGKVVAANFEKLDGMCCDVVINTTSVGMHPNINVSPLDNQLSAIKPGMIVFDTIYNPMKTKLIEQAECAGARTIGGVEMFVRQAAAQFEAWTHLAAPLDLMRQVVESRLKPA